MGLSQKFGVTGNDANGAATADQLPDEGNLAQRRAYKGNADLPGHVLLIQRHEPAIGYDPPYPRILQRTAGRENFLPCLRRALYQIHEGCSGDLVANRVGKGLRMTCVPWNPGCLGGIYQNANVLSVIGVSCSDFHLVPPILSA